jgi:hypothetical protein
MISLVILGQIGLNFDMKSVRTDCVRYSEIAGHIVYVVSGKEERTKSTSKWVFVFCTGVDQC